MITDDYIRKIWTDAGGKFHGPKVEQAYMTEAQLFVFLRTLLEHIGTAEKWRSQADAATQEMEVAENEARRWIGDRAKGMVMADLVRVCAEEEKEKTEKALEKLEKIKSAHWAFSLTVDEAFKNEHSPDPDIQYVHIGGIERLLIWQDTGGTYIVTCYFAEMGKELYADGKSKEQAIDRLILKYNFFRNGKLK